METILEKFKNVVIQIATPFSTGTGFYLYNHRLIVTNEHVVRGNKEVVVEGEALKRQMAVVRITDPKHDIALLSIEDSPSMPVVELSDSRDVMVGERVVALGHPYGLKFTATQGIVSNNNHLEMGVRYYQHDAALNPGNSGGPLIDQRGSIIGLNTFILQESDNIGFSLPMKHITSLIEEYNSLQNNTVGSKCMNCENLVLEESKQGKFCPHCGSVINLPSDEEDYEATGISLTIENILSSCGYKVPLSRRGPNQWEIRQGSARIYITYYEPNGLIAGDAVLCSLPNSNINEAYEFLLKQNYEVEGLTLSVKGNKIVLSLIIYDRYLSHESGLNLFGLLFQKADDLDNILVEELGCSWVTR